MPDHFTPLFEGKAAAVVAAMAGAVVRGMVGPGRWSWVEALKAGVTGAILALWVAPGLAAWWSLGDQELIAISVFLGMVGLPVTRGVIQLARDFRDNPGRFIGRGK